ncbi:hypothetical protein MHU86_943 [Fragilaria crotonensis]|nr:hypothetical protein MHU86_943 [Fragilaria crotonensis]
MTRSLLILLVILIDSSAAFAVFPQTGRLSETSLKIFGGLGDAFKNDDKLAPRKNEGLTGGPKYNDQVTINGKAIKAVVGQPVKTVANAARVKIPYNCQKGDCGTCVVTMNGKKVKACQMTIPAGKCTIVTN